MSDLKTLAQVQHDAEQAAIKAIDRFEAGEIERSALNAIVSDVWRGLPRRIIALDGSGMQIGWYRRGSGSFCVQDDLTVHQEYKFEPIIEVNFTVKVEDKP